MNIKLMAFDLDNTLFDESGKVPSGTVALLKRCMEQGVLVTIATGRMYPTARLIAHEIGANAPIICYNGACVRGQGAESQISYTTVDEGVAAEIAEMCKVRGLFLQLYSNDEIIVAEDNAYARRDPDSENAPVRAIGDLTEIKLPKTPKMMIRDDESVIKQLEIELKERYKGRVYIAQSMPDLLEIMDITVNKGFALERLAKHLGLAREEVAAFGDNSNDAEMVKWAGLGVAMGNAVESLKVVADYICENDRNIGVEEAIKRFVLKS